MAIQLSKTMHTCWALGSVKIALPYWYDGLQLLVHNFLTLNYQHFQSTLLLQIFYELHHHNNISKSFVKSFK